MWHHTRANIAPGGVELGREEDFTLAPAQGPWKDPRFAWAGGRGQGARRAASALAESRGRHFADVARVSMVGGIGETASFLAAAWKAAVPSLRGMGAEERALARLHSLLDPSADPLWAPKTRERYEGALRDFLLWQEDNRELLSGRGRLRGAEGLRVYLQGIAADISGEALWKRGKLLLRVLSSQLGSEGEEELRGTLRVWRRDANILHPPKTGAASPISLEALRELGGERRESFCLPISRKPWTSSP